MNVMEYPVVDVLETGKRIKALREANKMSVKQMQSIFGFTTPQAIYKWQWGQSLPDIENLLLMAKLWNVSIEDILVIN